MFGGRRKYLHSTSGVPQRTKYRQKVRERLQAERRFQFRRIIRDTEPQGDADVSNHSRTLETRGERIDSFLLHLTNREIQGLPRESPSHLCDVVMRDNDGTVLGTGNSMAVISSDCNESDTSSASNDEFDGERGRPHHEVHSNDEQQLDFQDFDWVTSTDDNAEEHHVDSQGFDGVTSTDDNVEHQYYSAESTEDDEEDASEEDADPLLQRPLCEFTPTTQGDALLMCLALGLRHSLTWAAIVDILSMINVLFDREVVRESKYFFLKYMEAGKQITVFHLYCPYCERYLGKKQELCESDRVVCDCGTEINNINQVSTYFLSFNLNDQIKGLFHDKKFLKAIDYRFKRKKSKPNAYEDIYDGEVYRELSGPGQVLGAKYNLSYMFNTDGFPVGGKSGKQTCWPIYMQINELPPEMRSDYMILAGLYVGRKDPNMKFFFHPFVEDAKILASTGVDWTYKGRQINSKIIPLCACVDTPARAKLLNMTAHNGMYGCSLCYCRAESTAPGLRYTIPLNGLQERTHEELILDATKAHANYRLIRDKSKRRVRGLIGLTPVHTLPMDLVRGVRPDTMHSKCLGNSDHITNIYYRTAGRPYYIGSDLRIAAVNECLLSIKPPSAIKRPPRSIQRLCAWKATGWRSWLLFYGVVCLKDIIPDEYVVHFSMLSSSMHIILQKSITPEDLERAEILILRYVFLFQDYFGKEEMVPNIHLLLHTKRDIECLGPSWTNTAFGFEGANRTLLHFKKNTSSIAKEIARKYLTFKALPILADKYATSENVFKFCEKMGGRQLKAFSRIGKAVLVGSGARCILNPEEFNALQNSMMLSFREALSYGRMIFNGTRFCTSSYSQSKRFDDSYISISGNVKCRIMKIYSISEESGLSVVLFVRELVLNEEPLFHDDYGKQCPIRTVDTDGELLAIRPEDIITQCVYMPLSHGSYICDMPYGCYGSS